MTEKMWWDVFCDTGNPYAYLIYKKCQGDKKSGADKDYGTGTESNTGGRLQ